MQKHYGRFLRHRLGFLCLLAAVLPAVCSAQSGKQAAPPRVAAVSPKGAQTGIPAGGWLPQESRVLPSRTQRMTQVFGDNGAVHPVTVLKVGPCVITQLKT